MKKRIAAVVLAVLLTMGIGVVASAPADAIVGSRIVNTGTKTIFATKIGDSHIYTVYPGYSFGNYIQYIYVAQGRCYMVTMDWGYNVKYCAGDVAARRITHTQATTWYVKDVGAN